MKHKYLFVNLLILMDLLVIIAYVLVLAINGLMGKSQRVIASICAANNSQRRTKMGPKITCMLLNHIARVPLGDQAILLTIYAILEPSAGKTLASVQGPRHHK